ncbi:hypothetical protein KIH74_25505 [Kineosporia sp. J2-2]|uniref:Uncharacterized protein n=1 Tax=Kineosporia corallincola TaxID=2835133 RepID=A0ABS5TML6_9ACTN|nr:hypothetical protein [Kineosporia corallincola]MBT0772327.1 hypothetical protein [Kineosporia corallincola]
MTFIPQPGQKVRVVAVKDRSDDSYVGKIGLAAHVFPTWLQVQFPDGRCVQAIEVAPVWQVGEVVTEEMGEPPVGSVVRIADSRSCWRRKNREWEPINSDGSRSSHWPPLEWDGLRLDGDRTLILVSLPDQPAEETERGRCAAPHPWVSNAVGCVLYENHDPEPHRSTILDQGVTLTWADQPTEEPKPSPTPEVREVPLSEMREGDWITIRREILRDAGTGTLHVLINHDSVRLASIMPGFIATVTREIKPLPTAPGTVGTATVRGVKGVRVMLCVDGDFSFWMSQTAIRDLNSHKPEHITDFVELLASEDQ